VPAPASGGGRGRSGGPQKRKTKQTMKFKRFTKPGFLKQIGRELLGRFFDRFKDGLADKKIELPGAGLKDDEYFKAMSRASATTTAGSLACASASPGTVTTSR
jgi:hypothetical protein